MSHSLIPGVGDDRDATFRHQQFFGFIGLLNGGVVLPPIASGHHGCCDVFLSEVGERSHCVAGQGRGPREFVDAVGAKDRLLGLAVTDDFGGR